MPRARVVPRGGSGQAWLISQPRGFGARGGPARNPRLIHGRSTPTLSPMSASDATGPKRVTVMGLGRFGGGLGAARWLATQGWQVLVTDRKPASEFADAIKELRPLIDAGRVTLHLGEHKAEDFTDCDMVIANPAVPRPWENPYLLAARGAGVRVETEIGLLIAALPAGIISVGVTGSAGKSTTSAMIFHALSGLLGAKGAARVFMGGNIGGSLLEQLDELRDGDVVVLELSSAMLHWIGQRGWSPRVAVWTNLAPNHLDWHGTLDHYAGSKAELLRHQRGGDLSVLGQGLDDAGGPAHGVGAAQRVTVSAGLARAVSVPGAHNQLNAAMATEAALGVLKRVGQERANLRERVEGLVAGFTGLEHRLQLCHIDARGRRYFNDSKCTTLAALKQALSALGEDRAGASMQHLHVIVGGDAKGQDLSEIGAIAREIGGLACIGRDGPAIFAACEARSNVKLFETLEEAVPAMIALLPSDGVLLLSPACASWDQFPNFEHRGRRFVELCRQHAGNNPS